MLLHIRFTAPDTWCKLSKWVYIVFHTHSSAPAFCVLGQCSANTDIRAKRRPYTTVFPPAGSYLVQTIFVPVLTCLRRRTALIHPVGDWLAVMSLLTSEKSMEVGSVSQRWPLRRINHINLLVMTPLTSYSEWCENNLLIFPWWSSHYSDSAVWTWRWVLTFLVMKTLVTKPEITASKIILTFRFRETECICPICPFRSTNDI
jgi:hypothetical protein